MYSKKHKFVFIHPQKTAGICVKQSIRATFKSENIEAPKGSCHWGLNLFDYYIDDDIKNYFKFSVVRNPWDRAVSYYYHFKKHFNYKKPFGIFCKEGWVNAPEFKLKNKFLLNGEIGIDFLIKFENLEEDFHDVMLELGVSDYQKLIKYDHGNNRTRDYKDCYTSVTKKMIEESAAWEIENFSYKF